MEEKDFYEKHNIHLERLSTQTLKLLLKENLMNSSDDILSVDMIQTILSILRKREGEIEIDLNDAWKQLQENICTLTTQEERISELTALAPEPEKPPVDKPIVEKTSANKPTKCSAFRRTAHTIRRSAIAAVLAFALLTGSVTAQAFGIDILGLLTTWTDEHFYFMVTGDKGPRNNKEQEEWDKIQETLRLYQISPNIIPRRYPGGYKLEEIEYMESDGDFLLNIPFYNEKGEYFGIRIGYYELDGEAENFIYEKDPGTPEQYIHNNMTFYLMKNADTVTGVWIDKHYVLLITGPISIQELKSIIDSIGGT